jgi:hypothetical protein
VGYESRSPLRSISSRGRCRTLPWSGPGPAPKHLRLPSPLRRPACPPRCRTDLQRMTAHRSRSFGFATPPTPFVPCGMGPGVFRCAAVRPVSRLAELPLMALHPPSRTSPALRSGSPGRPATASPSFRSSSRGVLHPFDALNPGNPLPGSALPARLASCRSPGASSRGSTLASVRLRRFSRPWRFTPPRVL